MARSQALTTLNPAQIGIGAEVFYEDALAISKLVNWVGGRRPQVHLSACVAPAGWGGGSEIGTAWIKFRGTATGFVEVLRFNIYINPDTVNVLVGARCFFAAAETGDVKFTIGGTSTTISFTNANNGTEKTGSLATSATGTGWQLCTVEIDQTAGAATTNYLRDVRVEDEEITSGLPAPLDYT